MKINSLGNEAIQIQIDGEDYSVADIVHKELLGVKHVKFAGVAPPHPLIKTLTIQVHTDGGNANELLKQAVSNASEKTQEILEAVKKEFPDVLKQSPRSEKAVPEGDGEEKTEVKPEPSEATAETNV